MIPEQPPPAQPNSGQAPEQGIATPVTSDRFPLFDSLRAVAALAVVVFHAGQAADALAAKPTDSWWETVVARLPVGVTIFFLISGFLLYRPFVAARLRGRRGPDLRGYARRRVLRIVPAYWVALALLFPLGLAWFPGGVWPDGLLIAGFGQLYSEETRHAGLGVSWSLSVEAAFYVLVPVYAAVAARTLASRTTSTAVRAELAGLAVLGMLSLGFSAWAFSIDRPALAETLPGNFLAFAFGMGLAVVSAAGLGQGSAPLRLVAERPWLPWALSGTVLLAAGTVAGLPELTGGLPERLSVGQYALEKALFALIAFLLLLPAVFGTDHGGWPRRLLSARFLAWIGLVSYGVYLWHSGIIQLIRQHPGPLAALPADLVLVGVLAIALVLALAAGAISFYLVERPALSLKDGLPAASRILRAPAAALRRRSRTRSPVVSTSAAALAGSRSAPREVTLVVGGGATAPRVARSKITELLGDHMAAEQLETVRLLITEVVANAFRHGGVDERGQITLTVRLDGARAHVDVRDTGRQGAPLLRAPHIERGDGFGLFLVNRLASAWGSAHEPALRVWFEVPRVAGASA